MWPDDGRGRRPPPSPARLRAARTRPAPSAAPLAMSSAITVTPSGVPGRPQHVRRADIPAAGHAHVDSRAPREQERERHGARRRSRGGSRGASISVYRLRFAVCSYCSSMRLFIAVELSRSARDIGSKDRRSPRAKDGSADPLAADSCRANAPDRPLHRQVSDETVPAAVERARALRCRCEPFEFGTLGWSVARSRGRTHARVIWIGLSQRSPNGRQAMHEEFNRAT